tara:strand:- start:264 stop:1298 length:1035 start_codon:yes stop_codon:yes gene_type:complete
MKSFNQFLISEAITKAAFEMETSIVNAVNGSPHTSRLVKEKAVKNIVKFLKSNGISGKAQMPNNNYQTNSQKWDVYFDGKVPGSTRTPKTDFMVGSTKISLKTGPAQLCSGGKNEALALYSNAIEKDGKKPSKIVEEIRKGIEKLAPASVGSTKGNVRQLLKSKTDKVLVEADKLNHKLKELVREQFASGGNIPLYFTQEAMSGEIKFNRNDGYASHILVTNFDGNNNSIYRTDDSSYIKKVASQVRPEIRMKSTSVKRGGVKTGHYRYWGIISLLTEEIEELENENLLQEGLLDRINGFIQNIIKKIRNFFERAINFIKDSWNNVLNFLEIDMDIIFNNYVRY